MSPPDITEMCASTLEYPAAHRDRLRKIAAAQDRSVAAQIRKVIADYLASHDDTGAPR